MEGILSLIKKYFAILFLSTLSLFCIFSQNNASSELLRFPLWYVMAEDPMLFDNTEAPKSELNNAKNKLQELAPFFIEGLVYGWNFSYTPYDKTRGVSEYFEITPIVAFPNEDYYYRFTDPNFQENTSKIEVWVEYDLTPTMILVRQRWFNAAYPTISGKGSASVFAGVKSIPVATELAAKSAIREYARTLVKNKPKEIKGQILLTDIPRYYIDAGNYVTDLDFFLKVSKIVEYTKF